MNLLRAFWHSPLAMAWATRLMMSAGLLLTIWLVLAWLAQQPVFALRTVLVSGTGGPNGSEALRHVSEADVRQALETGLVSHTFTSPLMPAVGQLATHPWVRSVSLRRAWPNRLLVRIEEHQPIAAWSDGRLLNQQGELFVGEKTAAAEDAETLYGCRLVDLSGPLGSHGRVLSRAIEAESLLLPHQKTLEAVSVTAHASWSIRLTGELAILLGREDLPTSWQTRLGQALESLPRLDQWVSQDKTGVGLSRLDLRYANGYSYSTLQQPNSESAGDRLVSVPSCLKHYRQGSRHAA